MRSFTTASKRAGRRLAAGAIGCIAVLNIVTFSCSNQMSVYGFSVNPQEPAKKTVPASAEQASKDCPEAEELQKNVQQLTFEVRRLNKRVADLEKDRLIDTLHEQLTREEKRGEQLQLHLINIAEKDAVFQIRMDQINQQLQPEKIESALAGVGSVHPEETREELRRRLINEKLRLQSQIDLQRQDRIRTLSSLATTDAAIRRLRQKLAEAERR